MTVVLVKFVVVGRIEGRWKLYRYMAKRMYKLQYTNVTLLCLKRSNPLPVKREVRYSLKRLGHIHLIN